MKTLRIVSALILAASMLFAFGCDTSVPSDTTSSTSTKLPEQTSKPAETDIQTAPQTEEQTDAVDNSAYVNPDFSIPGGFYASAAELKLTLPENAPSGAYITYTTDGNEPTAKSNKYKNALTVADSTTSVIRAACFDNSGKNLGYIKTNTYISAADSRFSSFVISLVTDEENLYGDDGIISNSSKSGSAWERPCHVEIFTANGEELISQDAGIRIFGGSSRGLSQKSFRIVARKDGYYDEVKYNGNGSFDAELFNGRKIIAGENAGQTLVRYDRFILRNGGNDSIQATAADPTRMTLTRDAVANTFMGKYAPGVANQTSRFSVVYLNGEYYGILDMKEDINDDYMQNVYGLNKDYVTVIKSELDTSRHCENHENGGQCRFCNVWFFYEVDDGADSELTVYEKMCKTAVEAYSKGTSERAAAYKALCEQIDIESFMQYMAVSLYCCNMDWPHNNVRVWRYTGEADAKNPYSDGKWRFSTRDMDFSFGRYVSFDILPELYSTSDMNSFEFTLGNYKTGKYKFKDNYPDSLYLQGLLALCLTDKEFCTAFDKFCETLASDGARDFLKSAMNDYSAQINSEMKRFISALKGTVSGKYSVTVWRENTAEMLSWADSRPAYFLKYKNEMLKNFQ